MSYTFLTKLNAQGPTTYFATTKTLETMSVGETYDRHGFKIDTDEVGDYEVKGFNFWNGNNWQTILVDSDGGEAEYEVIADTELTASLENALSERELFEDDHGKQKYTGGDYVIIHSQFASDFADWELVPQAEYYFQTEGYLNEL